MTIDPTLDNRHHIRRLRPSPHNQGEAHPRAKLTHELVARIRAMHKEGEKVEYIRQTLAPYMDPSMIAHICARTAWRSTPWWLEWTIPYGTGGP